jgi:hypothetical protein
MKKGNKNRPTSSEIGNPHGAISSISSTGGGIGNNTQVIAMSSMT